MAAEGHIVPLDATHVVLDMTIVPQGAFAEHPNIIEVICHESVEQEQINGAAFAECPSLRRVIMPRVKLLGNAFLACTALTDVECDELEIIREWAFCLCTSLRSIHPAIRQDSRGGHLCYVRRSDRRDIR